MSKNVRRAGYLISLVLVFSEACGSVGGTKGGAGGSGAGGSGAGTGGSGSGGSGAGTGGIGTGGVTGAGTGGAGVGGGNGGSGVGGGAIDAGTDAGPTGSGGVAATACDLSRPFGTPILVAGISGTGGDDGTGRLMPDELTIYFYSSRSGNNDIFMATRPSRSAAFGAPQPVAGINTASSEAWPSPTSDGLALYLESNVNGLYQVMVSTRTTLVAQFSAPALVANVNAGPSDGQVYVLPDQSALYMMTSRTGISGGTDIYRAARGSSGQFGAPVQVSTINTPSSEYAPVATSDELALYFASSRPDSPAKGNFDIWMAKRASSTANFDPPVNVSEINTTGEEWPDWLSPDRCRIYFTRAGSTGRKIYVAERTM